MMNIENEDLFVGEKVLISKNANLIVRPKEFGLKKFAFDDYLWICGMKDKEALGGRIHLTNYRIIFKTHAFNRLRGKVSIFLPTLECIKNSSFFITRKITVETYTSKVDFVIWGINQFIKEVSYQREHLTNDTIQGIKKMLIQNPQKSSDNLKAWTSINTINNLFLVGQKVSEGQEIVTNPLGALGAIFMKEFFDEVISERWQKFFNK